MLGFTRPFSPEGRAAAVPAFPWKFAGDLLLIHFKADPDALTGFLPEPLTPSEQPDEAFLWSPHLRCYPVGMDPATLNPARTHYNVAVVGIPCKFKGEPTMYSAFQWCDRDWLVILSWFLGSCSKQAQIEQSGTHPMLSAVQSPQSGGVGTTYRRSVTRHGDRIIDMSFTPDREIAMGELEFYTRNLPLTCERHIPDLNVPPLGQPALHDLTQMVMQDSSFGQPLSGAASLVFGDSDNEELLSIQPTQVSGGYWLPMGFNLLGITTIHDYLQTS